MCGGGKTKVEKKNLRNLKIQEDFCFVLADNICYF